MTRKERETQLLEWLEPYVRYGHEPLRYLRFQDGRGGNPENGTVLFCTSRNTFYISHGPAYLGCVASSRKQRAGEDWTRGSDLPDGPFEWGTFERIMQAIVGYELVQLEPEPQPQMVVGDPTGPSLGD